MDLLQAACTRSVTRGWLGSLPPTLILSAFVVRADDEVVGAPGSLAHRDTMGTHNSASRLLSHAARVTASAVVGVFCPAPQEGLSSALLISWSPIEVRTLNRRTNASP